MTVTRSSPIERDAVGIDDDEAPPIAPGGPLASPRLVLLVIMAAVAVPIVVTAVHVARQPWLPTSDHGLIFIRALDIPSHLPLTGAYSRYGFDHPGPLLFYVLSAPSHLLGPSGMLLVSGALNAAAAAGSCYVAWRRGGIVLATATAVILMLLVHAMGDTVVSEGNPWVALLPYFLSVLLAWGVSQRDWRLLPWLALSASYAAQAHVSYAPFAGLLVVAAVAWAAIARFRRGADATGPRPTVLIVGATFAVLAVVWLPPIVQQVRSDDGNLTKLAHHFLGDHRDETNLGPFTDMALPDQREVLGIVAREFGSLPPWTGAPEEVQPFTSNVVDANLWLLPAPFIVFGAVFVLTWRRRLRDALALQSIALALTVLSALTMTRVMGGLPPYIVRFTWVPASLVALSTCWSVCRLLGAPAPEAGGVTPVPTAPGSRAGTTTALVVAVLGVLLGISLWGTQPPDPGPSDMLRHIVDPIEQALTPGKEVRIAAGGSDAVTLVGGVEAELIRRGIPVAVDPAVASRYDPSHLGSDSHPATIVVVAGPDLDAFTPTPSQRLVTTYDPLTADEHRERDALRNKIVAHYTAIAKRQPPPELPAPDEQARHDELTARGDAVAIYVDPGA